MFKELSIVILSTLFRQRCYWHVSFTPCVHITCSYYHPWLSRHSNLMQAMLSLSRNLQPLRLFTLISLCAAA